MNASWLRLPVKNWLQRKGDALKAGFNSKPALRRHDVRLVADKLFSIWQHFTAMRRKAGTPADMGQFIDRVIEPRYGDYVGDEMRQDFPELFPNNSAAAPSQPAAQGATPPATQQPLAGAQAATAQSAQPQAIQPTASTPAASLSNTTMTRQGATQTTAQPAQPTQPSSLSNVSVTPRTAAQPAPAQPAAQATPQTPPSAAPPITARNQLPKASRNPNAFTQADYDKMPPSVRAQFDKQMGNESQRVTGRLLEAPPDLTIPNPPAGTPRYRTGPKTRPFVRDTRPPPDMSRPPAFLRQQRNQPTSAAQPAQAAAPAAPTAPAQPRQAQQPMSRATVDRYLVGLADVLLMHGGASVGPRDNKTAGSQGTNQQQVRQQQNQAGINPRQVINGQTLLNAMEHMRVDGDTIGLVSQIIAQNPTPSIAEIIQRLHGTKIDANFVNAILKAAGQH